MAKNNQGGMGEGGGKGQVCSIDCAEAGQGCTLKLSGTYDEVMAAAVAHARSAHGMNGDDETLGEQIKKMVHVQTTGAPISSQDRRQGGRQPGLPS